MRALLLLFLVTAACGGRTPMDVDATGCAGDAHDCPWGGCLDGPIAECVNGAWWCPPPPDHCGGGMFGCGNGVCQGTQYCEVSSGGPPPLPDAGPTVGYACLELPGACMTSGPATCACVEQYAGCSGGEVVNCTQSGGGISLECAFP